MILYALVARAKDGAVLVESIVAGVEGNYPQISIELLERIVASSRAPSTGGNTNTNVELLPDGGKKTFVQRHHADSPYGNFMAGWSCFANLNMAGDEESGPSNTNKSSGDLDYYFHLCRENGIICLCISDDEDVRHHEVNNDFLDDVKSKFLKQYSSHRVAKAKAYGMDKNFRGELGKLIYFYNENRSTMVRKDKVLKLLGSVDDLKGVLGKNITIVLERETKLDALVAQSDEMLSDTKVFTKRSSRLKTKMQRQYQSYYVAAFVFVLLVIYLSVAEFCGYTFSKCSVSVGGSAAPEEGD